MAFNNVYVTLGGFRASLPHPDVSAPHARELSLRKGSQKHRTDFGLEQFISRKSRGDVPRVTNHARRSHIEITRVGKLTNLGKKRL